ncbi:MAG: OmpH family outer membrane protein [Bacteroidales bacterium]|nr:OmpH family outer membrane protein [Bacteroidales bacterium]
MFMVEEQVVQDHPSGTSTATAPVLTFEQVWAILQDSAKKQEEAAKRQEEFAKRQEEFAKRQEERQEEAAKRYEEEHARFNERLGNLTNMFGNFTESMVASGLHDAFGALGFEFQKACRNIIIDDRSNKIHLKIDVMLENGDKAMLVEVKTKLTQERINKHMVRLEKMRKLADLRGDTRTFLGGVAGVIMTDDVKEYASEQGFYLIEPAGNTFAITAPKGKPREW